LGISKTSHFGTLDPAVSGVLPVALGRACRMSDYFMHRDKIYMGIMRLHEEADEKKLASAIKKFIGNITQLPPVTVGRLGFYLLVQFP
jgi:tRNA U55 pseudouridine synthase TruB